MPNWCENQLRIAGPRDEVRRFFARAAAGNTVIVDAIDVAHVIDPSNETAIANAVITSSRQDGAFSFSGHCPEPDPDSGQWYEWRCREWGTKWDANHVTLSTLVPRDDGTWECHVEFQTPWCPPYGWIAKVMVEHPELDIMLLWNEEQGLTGSFVTVDGVPTARDTSYDDHADMGWSGPFDPRMWEELDDSCAGDSADDSDPAAAIAAAQAANAAVLSSTSSVF